MLQLIDHDSALLAVGKAAVFWAPVWDFGSDLMATLQPLGLTEGEVAIAFNESFNALTLPEYTGDMWHKKYVSGEAPVATIPLILANPTLRATVSPTGAGSGGYRRQRPVVEHTLALIPEELFINPADPSGQADQLALSVAGGEFLLDGSPLTADQQAMLDTSIWLWRGHWMKPQYRFRHEDGGKAVEGAEFHIGYQKEAPNGQRAYTLGDPFDNGIDVSSGLVESGS